MRTKRLWIICLALAMLAVAGVTQASDVTVTWTMPTEGTEHLAGFQVTIDGIDSCRVEDPTATTVTCMGAVPSPYGTYGISIYAFDTFGQAGLSSDIYTYSALPRLPGKPGVVAVTIK